VKELMVYLVDDEESFGECGECYFVTFSSRFNLAITCLGYYLATLEASTQHITELAQSYEKSHKATAYRQSDSDVYFGEGSGLSVLGFKSL